MQSTLTWVGDMRVDALPDSGSKMRFDSDGQTGPSPMEALLMSLAACTAMDVISILQKKRQNVVSYKVEVSGERPPKGEWPRPFLKIYVKHLLEGENIDPAAVARAVQLSDEKYCSVSATLREKPEITNTWQISSPKN